MTSDGLDELEGVVDNPATRRNSIWVIGTFGSGALYAFSLNSRSGPITGGVMLCVTAWYLWVAFRPPRFDPFLRVLRERPGDVEATFVYEVRRLGAHANTWIALKLRSGRVIEVAVPAGQGEHWRSRIIPLLPQAEHCRGAP